MEIIKFLVNFFYNKINKNYNSYAYTTIIKHQKINNEKAVQIFTKIGPLLFYQFQILKLL